MEVWCRGRSSEEDKGAGNFPIWFFSRFIIFTFRNCFSLCQIVLCIWRKTIVLWKKYILSCLKMNLKISHKLNLIYLYIKGFKKSKLIIDIKQHLNWFNHLFNICLNPLIMCKEGWCVGLGQEEVAWGCVELSKLP